jgi:hypothetical protein
MSWSMTLAFFARIHAFKIGFNAIIEVGQLNLNLWHLLVLKGSVD